MADDYEDLWKVFFDTIGIKERECQMSEQSYSKMV